MGIWLKLVLWAEKERDWFDFGLTFSIVVG